MKSQQTEQQLDHTAVKMDDLTGRIGKRKIRADTQRIDTIGDLFRKITFDQIVQPASRGDAAKQQVPTGERFPDAFAEKTFGLRAGKTGADDDRIKDTKEDRDRKPAYIRK